MNQKCDICSRAGLNLHHSQFNDNRKDFDKVYSVCFACRDLIYKVKRMVHNDIRSILVPQNIIDMAIIIRAKCGISQDDSRVRFTNDMIREVIISESKKILLKDLK